MKRALGALACAALLAAAAVGVRATWSAPSDAERVADALRLLAELREACAAFRATTGRDAKEYCAHPAECRELSASRPSPDRPPFLPRALRPSDGSISARVHVLDSWSHPPNADGFDLDGDGTFDVPAECQVVRFIYAEERFARALDVAIDGEGASDWRNSGRVRFFHRGRAGKPGVLDVLIRP